MYLNNLEWPFYIKYGFAPVSVAPVRYAVTFEAHGHNVSLKVDHITSPGSDVCGGVMFVWIFAGVLCRGCVKGDFRCFQLLCSESEPSEINPEVIIAYFTNSEMTLNDLEWPFNNEMHS